MKNDFNIGSALRFDHFMAYLCLNYEDDSPKYNIIDDIRTTKGHFDNVKPQHRPQPDSGYMPIYPIKANLARWA